MLHICVSTDIYLRQLGVDQLLLTVELGGKTMSHTIRNEKTKGFLDKLALKRRTRKVMRELKADEVLIDWDENLIPSAEI